MSRSAPGRGVAGRICARLTLGAALVVSSLYAWYRDDFGGTEAGVIAHLERYARPELAKALKTVTAIDG